MKIIQIVLTFLISFSSFAATTNRIILKFKTEENKAAWIKLGCYKAEQFDGTNIIALPDTTVALSNKICLPHRGGFSTCYEGDISSAEVIAGKMADNSDGYQGFSLVSKKILREKDTIINVHFHLRKSTENETENDHDIASIPPCTK